MKRKNHFYEQICDIGNLRLADRLASRGKSHQYGVQLHRKNQEENLLQLQNMLLDKTYRTSEYTTMKVYEPKERTVYRLPYFPDRIAHHAIMNILEPVFVDMFTADTYSCIKGRGIHGALYKLKKALKNTEGTIHCLKLDIRKFYPEIDHVILKALLRRKFKDKDLLWLLDEIIDSAPGVPIGNYLSQYFANFYLTGLDHWLKEVKKVKYYFRYADDLVILADNKPYLHQLRADIASYLELKLNLQMKGNYQVFPVSARGIDFLGYVSFHSHILLRKRIKKNFARKMAKGAGPESLASYLGWLIHCNSKNLTKKITNPKNEEL
ncbi:MAG: RNA-directed DNA polymerase [Bacteroidia bacterium]